MKIRNILRDRTIELVYPTSVIYLIPGQEVEVNSEPLNYEAIKRSIVMEKPVNEVKVNSEIKADLSEVKVYEPVSEVSVDLVEVKQYDTASDLSEGKKVVKRRRGRKKKK